MRHTKVFKIICMLPLYNPHKPQLKSASPPQNLLHGPELDFPVSKAVLSGSLSMFSALGCNPYPESHRITVGKMASKALESNALLREGTHPPPVYMASDPEAWESESNKSQVAQRLDGWDTNLSI